MTFLREVVRIELAAITACFAMVVGWKLLRGAVRSVRHPETRRAFRGGITGVLRLQMLVSSLVIALLYLLRLPQSAARDSLPPVPEYALALLAGSQVSFLVAMARHLLRPVGILRIEGEK